jgi:SAM-dependent methyltransferase
LVGNIGGGVVDCLYDRIGGGYAKTRVADARIGRLIDQALGDATDVVNVGAGTGNYEPRDRRVIAVEPSSVMIAQRPPSAAVVVKARAEALPFGDASFEAAMAVWTLHHWADWRAGVAEMRRVASRRVVIATRNPQFVDAFWLTREYLPGAAHADAAQFPTIDELVVALGGADMQPIPIPRDCSDGFMAAYWARPEAFLDPVKRAAISTLTRVPAQVLARALERLTDDLQSGAWDHRHRGLREKDELDLGYRLLVSEFGAGGWYPAKDSSGAPLRRRVMSSPRGFRKHFEPTV